MLILFQKCTLTLFRIVEFAYSFFTWCPYPTADTTRLWLSVMQTSNSFCISRSGSAFLPFFYSFVSLTRSIIDNYFAERRSLSAWTGRGGRVRCWSGLLQPEWCESRALLSCIQFTWNMKLRTLTTLRGLLCLVWPTSFAFSLRTLCHSRIPYY